MDVSMSRLSKRNSGGLCLQTTPRISSEATVREGLFMISEAPDGMLVVQEHGRPKGVLTDAHLARLIEMGCNLWEIRVGDVMRPLAELTASGGSPEESRLDKVLQGLRGVALDASALCIAGEVPKASRAPVVPAPPSANGGGFGMASLLDELADVGIIVIGEDGSLQYFNKSAETMIPELAREQVGQPLDVSALWRPADEQETRMLDASDEARGRAGMIVTREQGGGTAYFRVTSICGASAENSLVDIHYLTDVTGIFAKVSCVEKAALYDSLTGLPNRAMFVERLHREIKRSRRYGKNFTLLVIDLDNFKDINDRHGHLFGDSSLKAFGRTLSAIFRESDTIARIGGDEFTIILPEIVDTDSCKYVIEKIAAHLEKPINVGGVGVLFQASVGCAIFPVDGGSYETLFSVADARMYAMKRQNKS